MDQSIDSSPVSSDSSSSGSITGIFRFIITNIFDLLYRAIMGTLGSVFDPLQKYVGVKWIPYLFVIPNMILFAIFAIFPIFLNFYYAVTTGTALMPQGRTFVGMQNFNYLMTCGNFLDPNSCSADLFWRGVMNTAFYVIFEVIGIIGLSLLTASLLNRQIMLRGFFRSIFFYPVLLSSVVIALLWKWILQRNGLLNGVATNLGMESVNFLIEPDWARLATIIIGLWSSLGFYTLIILAGLQAIPALLYEAATIDGASRRQQFQYITLPLLRPTLYIVFILSFVGSVQVFDHVYVLTEGGPGTATLYIMQYVYNTAFTGGPGGARNIGLATAATLLVAVVLIIFTVVQRLISRSANDDFST